MGPDTSWRGADWGATEHVFLATVTYPFAKRRCFATTRLGIDHGTRPWLIPLGPREEILLLLCIAWACDLQNILLKKLLGCRACTPFVCPRSVACDVAATRGSGSASVRLPPDMLWHALSSLPVVLQVAVWRLLSPTHCGMGWSLRPLVPEVGEGCARGA